MPRLREQEGYNFGALTTLFGDLGPLLRQLRRRAERSQAEAAAHIGKTPRVISGYESGEIAPSGDTFDRLLVFYGIADLVQLQGEIDAIRGGARLEPRESAPSLTDAKREQLVDLLLDYHRLKREEEQRAASAGAQSKENHDT